VTYGALKESPLGQEEGAQSIKEEKRKVFALVVERGHKSLEGKTDQSDSAM